LSLLAFSLFEAFLQTAFSSIPILEIFQINTILKFQRTKLQVQQHTPNTKILHNHILDIAKA